MPLQVWPFARQLVRCDHELLFGRRRQSPRNDAHGSIAHYRKERIPRELPAQGTVQDERCRQDSRDGREPSAGEKHVHVRVARADERS